MSKGSYPTQEPDKVPAAAVREIVTNLRELHDRGRPQSDEEVEQRVDDFFAFCESSSIRPGVESLCTALHISSQTFSNWTHGIGCSKERQEIITTAKAFINACLEQMVLCGRISPPTGIFLLKNWAGYKDVFTRENITVKPEEPDMSPEEIRQQLEQDIPIDADYKEL